MESLTESAAHWRDLASNEIKAAEMAKRYGDVSSYFARARTYTRTAEALEHQSKTGVAICSCCHKPIGSEKPYWLRGGGS